MAARTTPKAKQNRRGRPTGYKLPAKSIERIRASINTKLAIDTLHSLCTDGGQHDGVRATAAATLLRKVLPDLSATDLTSDGESIVVERVSFKATRETK
jgi:hypothetical protein